MQPKRPRRLASLSLLVAAAGFALTACGDDGTSSGATTGGTVRGTTWTTQELTVNGVRSATPAGSRIEITLGTDGKLAARAGCNGMGGRYLLKGDVLSVDDLAMTSMACAPELMALDTTIAELLGAEPTVALVGSTLTIASATTSIALVDLEKVEPTPPLVGTTWTLDTIIAGQAASSLPQGLPQPITLVFGDDGRYTIVTGCNGVGGTYARDGDALALTAGPSTLIGCPSPLDTIEATIGRTMSGAVTTSIQRQRLTVTAKDGNGLGFTAKP